MHYAVKKFPNLSFGRDLLKTRWVELGDRTRKKRKNDQDGTTAHVIIGDSHEILYAFFPTSSSILFSYSVGYFYGIQNYIRLGT